MFVFMTSILYIVKSPKRVDSGGIEMKVSREQVAEHKTRILEAAGRLFRQRGFDHVTVAEIMKAAGLTHGGFYGHFPSKEALIAEAFAPAPPGPAPRKNTAAYADSYLSVAHRDDLSTACAFSALGTEAARGSAELRASMTESTRRQIERFSADAPGKTARDKRRAAIAAWSAMVGAMVLARIVEKDLSDEILKETRAALLVA
jgi:TetR/AcrR family transcriptional repressor of nem operon